MRPTLFSTANRKACRGIWFQTWDQMCSNRPSGVPVAAICRDVQEGSMPNVKSSRKYERFGETIRYLTVDELQRLFDSIDAQVPTPVAADAARCGVCGSAFGSGRPRSCHSRALHKPHHPCPHDLGQPGPYLNQAGQIGWHRGVASAAAGARTGARTRRRRRKSRQAFTCNGSPTGWQSVGQGFEPPILHH